MTDFIAIENFVEKNFFSHWGSLDKNLIFRYCEEYKGNPNKKGDVFNMLQTMKNYFI